MIEIIAEVANSHEGNIDRAIKIALDSIKSGADSVKFQIYFGDDLLTKDHERHAHFSSQAFSREQWIKTISQLKQKDIKVYADVFGLEALETAIESKVDGIKIHSSDLSNIPLIESCALTGLPIFLAVGGSTLREIATSIEVILNQCKEQKIILLSGFQAYPTKIKNNNLLKLQSLKQVFGDTVEYGFMDHTDGSLEEASTLPSLSIALGCSYIEKHVTDNRSLEGVDYFSSLEPKEFKKFVKFSKTTQEYLGKESLKFCDDEKEYRNSIKKIWVASKGLKKGDILTLENISMKRSPKEGIQDLSKILRKEINSNIKEDEPINLANLSNKTLAIVVARSESTRLPGKASLPVGSCTTLEHLFQRLELARSKGSINSIAFCTTYDNSDDDLAEFVSNLGIKVFRGDVDNVLKRMSLAVAAFPDHDVVLRITGDDILCDPSYLKKTVEHHLLTGADYTDAKSLPSGTEVEVFHRETLKYIIRHALDTEGTEYLTNYITHNQDIFKCSSLEISSLHSIEARLTLDTKEDYEVIKGMLKEFNDKGKEFTYTMDDIASYFQENPSELTRNKLIIQKQIPKKFTTKIQFQKEISKPLVTIYIVNYNYGRFLKRAIDSVLSQTLKNFQLLVIDDGSNDDSSEILDFYEEIYGVTVIRNSNKGLTASNNEALKLARGKYITRLDADDYLHKDALRQLSNYLEENQSLVAVFPDYAVVDQDENIMRYDLRHNFQKEVNLFDSPAHGACTLIKLETLKKVGGYNENYLCQDGWDVWIKLLNEGEVENINLPLFFYRQHESNLTKDKRKLFFTRSNILKNHNKIHHKEQLSSLCIIPIRDSTTNPISLLPIKKENLLLRTIQQALKAERIDQIVVSTNNTLVIEEVRKMRIEDVIIHDRNLSNKELSRDIDSVVNDVLIMDKLKALSFNAITVLNYEYPFRSPHLIDQSLDIIQTFKAESSMTVKPLNLNFFRNLGNGLQAEKDNADLRKEREIRYAEWGGIHSVLKSSFKKNNRIHQGLTATIELDESSSFKIESDFDFQLASSLDYE
tara:strand:+ start:12207 stop:15320 length:3114 start_codon:yes stop_codon:yes gene_type:complete